MARDYEGMIEGQDSSNARQYLQYAGNPLAQYFNPNTSSGYQVGNSGQYTTAPFEMLQLADQDNSWSLQDIYDKVFLSSPAKEAGKSFQQFLTEGISPWQINSSGRGEFNPEKHTQWIKPKNIGAMGMLKEFATSPIMKFGALAAGAGGLSSMAGAAGAGAGAAGGAMDMGIGLGGELGSWGGITPIAEGAGAGIGAGATTSNFIMDFPMGESIYALEIPTDINWDLFNEAGSFTGDPSAGWNLADAAAGIPEGINWDLFNEPGSLKGFDTSGGFAGTQGGIISQIARALGLPIDEAMKKATTNPLLKTMIDTYGIWSKGKTADEVQGIIRQGMAQSDPFGGERAFYQDKLRQSYSDPNFFRNDPVLKGLRDMDLNDVRREAAARGFNNSSNLLYNIGERLNNTGSKYALNYQNQLGQLAGGGISPAGIGQLTAQGANLAQQQGIQKSGDWGSVIRELPNALGEIDKLTSPGGALNFLSPP